MVHYARTYGAQVSCLKPYLVSVETDIALGGTPLFSIVGLADRAIDESRDRVSAAIKHTGFESPKSGAKKIIVSLAPADLRKEGPMFDVAIALAYLLAMDEIRFDPEPYLFIGELSLDGAVRPVPGVLPLVAHALKVGKRAVFVPKDNEREAAMVDGVEVYGVRTLGEIIEHLNEKEKAVGGEGGANSSATPLPLRGEGAAQNQTPQNSGSSPLRGRGCPTGQVRGGEEVVVRRHLSPAPRTEMAAGSVETPFSFEDIRGQESAKRAAVICAAGGHNLGLYGPPGTGKTMLARAIASIMPPLSFEDMLEVNSIHSVVGGLRDGIITTPPIRSPHHTSSYVALVGGGSNPRPGEATLAHKGVLFLDEFPEFDRRVLEALRQPLEDRVISISRAKGSVLFPARFTLVAAMNPCPCGNWGHPTVPCTCVPMTLERYRRKISGPIADRVDLWTQMGPVELSDLGKRSAEGTETKVAREEVARARAAQLARFGTSSRTNSDLSARELDAMIPENAPARALLAQAGAKMNLSPRGYHRTLKVARTIADLAGAEILATEHVLEALQYRQRKD